MVDRLSTQSARSRTERQSKTREILDGMSRYRIDPRTIKTTRTKPHAKGRLGTVRVGTIISPGVSTWIPEKWILERKYAIKKLDWNRRDAEASAKFLNFFAKELHIMKSLAHPNIVKFVGFVEDEEKGDAWIVSPWESNGNIREFLGSGEWHIPERVSLIQDVVHGVEYLHTRQPPICHGDLKSMNILVSSSYHAVITDFGCARIRERVNATTQENGSEPPRQVTINNRVQEPILPRIEFNQSTLEVTLTGAGYTLRWTAPEVLRDGFGARDLASDIWAVAWICWEILTGEFPFQEPGVDNVVISKVMKGRLPAIGGDADLSLVLKLCRLMMDCWILNPVERIDASTLRREVRFLPSSTPSADMSGGAKVRSAALLLELGTMYWSQNNVVAAESHYQAAIEVAIRTKDEKAKAIALNGLGEICHAQSRYREAEEAFMKAREIHSRIGDDLGVADALDGLGRTYRAQLRNQEAEKAFTKVHEICSRIGPVLGTGNALRNLAMLNSNQNRCDSAEVSYGQEGASYHVAEAEESFAHAREIYTRQGNHRGQANASRPLDSVACARQDQLGARHDGSGDINVHTTPRLNDTTAQAGDSEEIAGGSSSDPLGLESLIASVSSAPVNVNGHFCDVFQGVHNIAGKVALKRPRIAGAEYDGDVIRRFEREAETWRHLRHPYILEFLGTLRRDGHLYLVSPFINNGTLVEYLFQYPNVKRIRLLRETADAIQYLHTQKVVHGDIKGTNILISDDAHVLLCDFGLTKMIDSRTSTCVKGAGSVRWMSPELWDNEPRTFESDVYAFGMTIAEVLTGQAPFSHLSSSMAVMMAVGVRNERPSKDPASSPDGESYEEAWNVAAACWPTGLSERISMAEAHHRLLTEHAASR